MLNTLNSDIIARQKAQSARLEKYTDSLSVRNMELNSQLQGMIKKMLLLSYVIIHQNVKRICRYRKETNELIDKLQKTVVQNNGKFQNRRNIPEDITKFAYLWQGK